MELAQCNVQYQALNVEALKLRVMLQTAINAMHLGPMIDRGSSAAAVSRLRSKQSRNRGSLFPPRGNTFFTSPKHHGHLRNLTSPLLNGYLVKCGRGVKLTTHPCLTPRLSISGAMYSNGTNKYTQVQQGLLLRRGYVLKYLVVNRIVVKRVLFKWFKLRQVHGPKKAVKYFYNSQHFFTL